MKNLIKKLYEIKADKYIHLIFGLIIYEFLFAISVHFLPLFLSVVLSVLITTIIAASKEWIYDVKHGVPNKIDFYFTEIGCIIGVLIMLI